MLTIIVHIILMKNKSLSSFILDAQRQQGESTSVHHMEISVETPQKLIKPLVSYASISNPINLCTPIKTSVGTTTNMACTITKDDYKLRTINTSNQARLTILPAFPTSIYDDHPHLLLANVPIQFL